MSGFSSDKGSVIICCYRRYTTCVCIL